MALQMKPIVVLFLIAATAVAYPPKVAKDDEDPSEMENHQHLADNECTTDGCKKSAALLLKSMDMSVDPCEDFFRFSCGHFIKANEIPDDRAYVSVISQMDSRLKEQMRLLLEEEDPDQDPKPFRHARELYRACMNTTLLEEQGLTPAREKIAQLGGWPVLQGAQWNESDFDWVQMNYKLAKEGLYGDFIFTVAISYDITNTSRHGIVLNMAKLVVDPRGLDPDMVIEILLGYHKLSTEVAVMFGANRTTARKEMMDVINFELALGNITKSREARRDIMSWLNPMNISTLTENYPFVPWRDYFNNVMLSSAANISDEEVVVVYDKEYMSQVNAVIRRTPKRTVANYMVWRAVMSQLHYLNAEASRLLQDFENGIKGQVKQHQRWEDCVQEVQGKLSFATASMYVRRYFPEDARKVAREMVQNIRQEMYELLESVDWMDETTRQAAVMKARRMHYGVGYPDELLQNDTLEKYYQGLDVKSGSYLESVLELNKFLSIQASTKLRELVNKTSWTSVAAKADIVNAYYNLAENSLSIPAGILQGAFFSSDRPQYLNYGAIGSAIGHEVTHAFDDRGRLFNMDGVLVNWWEKETQQRFTEKVQCVVEQYSNYTDKQVNAKLNGVITQGENIADNAGVKLAYRAYVKYESQHGAEPRLALPTPPRAPHQPLSPHQLFWVGFAAPWCAKYRSKDLRITLRTSPHLPGEYRVNGALSNQEEFAKDFSCPKGSPMNPTKKCQLW